jgi:HAD superfamily hydrolase (TIGR01458 family)
VTSAAIRGLPDVRGVLLDIDGTLLVDDRAVPEAPQALERLRAAGLAVRLLTNTSRRSRGAIADVLRSQGFAMDAAGILTPAVLARRLILESGRLKAALLVPDEARADFEGIAEEDSSPDWVVLGDLGAGFTYAAMNGALRLLRSGAALIALHRNPSWRPPGGEEALDVGAYVTALEYASGERAVLVGKPAPQFFRLALREIDRRPEEVLVVGDDPVADVAGAAAAGCRTAWVRAGRNVMEAFGDAGLRPDLVLDAFPSLPWEGEL